MRASLLLLFVFCHYSSASGPNWEECGKGNTALCRVGTCNFDSDGKSDLKPYEDVHIKTTCYLGVHIKPESRRKWTISIVIKDHKTYPLVLWKIGGNQVCKCANNKAEPGDNIPGSLMLNNIGGQSAAGHTFCVFTVESQSTDIADILEQIKRDAIGSKYTSLSYDANKIVEGSIEYSNVDDRIPCKKENLFSDTCDKETEVCTDPTNAKVNIWNCPTGYYPMYRDSENSNFTKAKITCFAGEFSVHIESEPKPRKVVAGSVAKCAAKRCSLCGKPKISNKPSITKYHPSVTGECAILNCTKGFMVLNTIKADTKVSLATPDNVQCSVKTTDAKKNARWVVDEDDEVEIESAECRDSVNCDLLANNKIDAKCKETDENCNPAVLQASGEYTCRNGTMHVEANKTNVRIDQPKCEADGTWKITLHSANSSTTVMWGKGTPLNIKCILDPVAKSVEAPVEGGGQTWLIILMVFLLLFVVAVAVGVFCFFKRKNKKKPAPTPSKTTSSTTSKDTLKKLSSSENEPMTSAMKSTTGESVKTAVEQKPAVAPAVEPVLAKVDLREQTATSPDSSPKKEKKSDPKPAKKEEKKSVKKSKEDTWDASYGKPSDETSKNQDVTSTKEKVALLPKSAEDPKSQTGGDGESQVENNKKGENAKLLPKGTPRKYTKSSTKAQPPKNPNTAFINVTDSDDEPSQTGSKKKKNKRR